MKNMITVEQVDTGLPVRSFVSSSDFPGDKPHAWFETHEYRVTCRRCGLVDKADTLSRGALAGVKHLRRGHK